MTKRLPTYKKPFRRRGENKTNYKKRLRLLLSKKPRLVVRKSRNYVTVQIVAFGPKGDLVMAAASSKELKKLGWTFSCDTTPAAYLTGLLAGKRTMEKNIHDAIVDSGLYPSTKGSRIYAAVRGFRDAGMDIPVDEAVFPDEKRLSGKHLAQFNEKFQGIHESFEAVKRKIAG